MNREGNVADMHDPTQTHQEPNYMGVFWWLLGLTIVEVAVGYSSKHLPRFYYVGVLMILAGVKAALVAAYFMHLKFERRTLTFIAVFPVLLLVILTMALFPDAWSFITQPK
jgi:cytochrome c oxidase subunit 4